MLEAWPCPSIYNKLAAWMVFFGEELMSDLSIQEIKATCSIAHEYSIWITTGDPQVLRKAYQEMAAVFGRERSVSNPFRFRFLFAPEYLSLPAKGTRTERQVAAGFLAMAGVVLASQWNQIKHELFGS